MYWLLCNHIEHFRSLLFKEMKQEYRVNFEHRLSASEAAKLAVVKYINRQGMPCSVNPSIMVPKGQDPDNYKDGGDLFMHFRTEVKHRPKLDFTCGATFPFDTILICSQASFDDQAVVPRYYFICNGPMTHAALVDVKKTRNKWRLITQKDQERGYSYPAYVLHKSEAAWIQL